MRQGVDMARAIELLTGRPPEELRVPVQLADNEALPKITSRREWLRQLERNGRRSPGDLQLFGPLSR